MDFDEALKDHFDWKLKFRNAIAQESTMDVATISKDNCCELGKWLQGEASSKYRQLTKYTNCVNQHKLFHIEAGKIASVINARNYAEAEAMLAAGTPYLDASIETGVAIKELKHEFELHGKALG